MYNKFSNGMVHIDTLSARQASYYGRGYDTHNCQDAEGESSYQGACVAAGIPSSEKVTEIIS